MVSTVKMNQLNPLPNFAEKDKTLVMTGIHKWSHAQYFTTRLHLIFFSVLDLVHHKLLALRPSWKTATKVRTAAADTGNFIITFTKIKEGRPKKSTSGHLSKM